MTLLFVGGISLSFRLTPSFPSKALDTAKRWDKNIYIADSVTSMNSIHWIPLYRVLRNCISLISLIHNFIRSLLQRLTYKNKLCSAETKGKTKTKGLMFQGAHSNISTLPFIPYSFLRSNNDQRTFERPYSVVFFELLAWYFKIFFIS